MEFFLSYKIFASFPSSRYILLRVSQEVVAHIFPLRWIIYTPVWRISGVGFLKRERGVLQPVETYKAACG
jgi:hypothetical protein